MTTYFDSSALVAVYVTERFSPRSREEVRRAGQIPWTGLHELEVRNTLRLLCGRRVIDAHATRLLASHLDEDVDGGRLLRIDVDYPAVFALRSCTPDRNLTDDNGRVACASRRARMAALRVCDKFVGTLCPLCQSELFRPPFALRRPRRCSGRLEARRPCPGGEPDASCPGCRAPFETRPEKMAAPQGERS